MLRDALRDCDGYSFGIQTENPFTHNRLKDASSFKDKILWLSQMAQPSVKLFDGFSEIKGMFIPRAIRKVKATLII